EVYERPTGRDPARVDIALQRNGADGDGVSAAEQRDDAVAQSLVKHVLEDAGERGNRDPGWKIVRVRAGHGLIHSLAQLRQQLIHRIEADDADARVFEIQNNIGRDRQDGRKPEDVNPT